MAPAGFHAYPNGFPPPQTHSKPRHPIVIFIMDFFSWLTKGRAYPHPHVWDFAEESQLLMRFFSEFWHLILIVLGSILLLIVFLLALIRLAMIYDRYTSRHGAMGTQLSRREDAMVRACEKRGRGVMERMEKERLDRIWAETERRQAIRDEHLRRKSILQGKLPMMSMIGEETIEGVGEGPAPKPTMERRKSKRDERRGDGTQVFSQEEDILRKRLVSTLPAGAEARIGNSVWRSTSGKTIHRTNSQPSVYYSGSFRTLLGSLPARGTGFSDGSDDDAHPNQGDQGLKAKEKAKLEHSDQLPETRVPFLRRLSFESDRDEVLDVPAIEAYDDFATGDVVSNSGQVDPTDSSSTDSRSTVSSSGSGISVASPMPTRIPSSIRSPILDATPYVSPDEISPKLLAFPFSSSGNSSSSPSHETSSFASDRLPNPPLRPIHTPYHTPYQASSLSLATDHLLGEPLSPITTNAQNPKIIGSIDAVVKDSEVMVNMMSPPGSVAASIDTLHGRIEGLRLGRLSFEVPGGWGSAGEDEGEDYDNGNGDEKDRRDGNVGAEDEEDREVDVDKGKCKGHEEGGGGWWPW